MNKPCKSQIVIQYYYHFFSPFWPVLLLLAPHKKIYLAIKISKISHYEISFSVQAINISSNSHLKSQIVPMSFSLSWQNKICDNWFWFVCHAKYKVHFGQMLICFCRLVTAIASIITNTMANNEQSAKMNRKTHIIQKVLVFKSFKPNWEMLFVCSLRVKSTRNEKKTGF